MMKDVVNQLKEAFSGRILVRFDPHWHEQAVECAEYHKISLNEFLVQAIQQKVVQTMELKKAFNRVEIEELKYGECREAAILAQYPYFMRIVNQYNICFLRDDEHVSPMRYVFFYETVSDSNGLVNQNPRHIAKWARVREIIYDIHPSDFIHIPELVPLTQDTELWKNISTWGSSKVVLFENYGLLDKPLRLENGNKARGINNKTIHLWKFFNANVVDDLLDA